MFYLAVVFVSILLISLINFLFSATLSLTCFAMILLSVTLSAIAVFIIDAISALAVRRLTPQIWYLPGRRIFSVSKNERNFYNKLKITSWKDLVPELGGFTSFHKDKLVSISDRKYLKQFIVEANYGVIIHLANALLGVFIAFIPCCNSPSVWIPVFAVNFILSILPVIILRHTSYTLLRLYNRGGE